MKPHPLLLAIAITLGGCVSPGPTQPEPEPVTATPQPPACASKPPRKVLITAFPLRYPEQIKSGQFMDWAQVTGEELSRTLERNGRTRASAAAQRFPFEDATLSTALALTADGKPTITQWANEAGAQYVLAGIFHDFGEGKKRLLPTLPVPAVPERQMRVEAFIHDAHDGALIARQEFNRPMIFADMPRSVTPGTQAFASSRLGEAYTALIKDIADWTDNVVSCQPFSVRITQVDNRRMTLNAGSTVGIAPGMALQSWRPGTPPPRPTPGNIVSARPIPTAEIKEVQPGSSLAEMTPQRFPPVLKVGDVLYLTEPTQPVVTPAVTPAVAPPPAIPPARNKL